MTKLDSVLFACMASSEAGHQLAHAWPVTGALRGGHPCRYPTLPVAELQRHQAPVNAVAWAPHSSCHICSAGDDAQALIWDLSSMSHPMDQGLGEFWVLAMLGALSCAGMRDGVQLADTL